MIVKDGPGTIGGVVDGTCTLRVFDQQTFFTDFEIMLAFGISLKSHRFSKFSEFFLSPRVSVNRWLVRLAESYNCEQRMPVYLGCCLEVM